MMEFYFNEEKCIENNIDINKVYEFLDEKIVEEGRMTKLDDGIYQGEGYFKIRLGTDYGFISSSTHSIN